MYGSLSGLPTGRSGCIPALDAARWSLQLGRLLVRRICVWAFAAFGFLILVGAGVALDAMAVRRAGRSLDEAHQVLMQVDSLHSALNQVAAAGAERALPGEARAAMDRAVQGLVGLAGDDPERRARMQEEAARFHSDMRRLERAAGAGERSAIVRRSRDRARAIQEEQFTILSNRLMRRQLLVAAAMAFTFGVLTLGLLYLAGARRQFLSLVEEQQRARDQYLETGRHYALLGESLPAILFTTTPQGACTYVNLRYQDYTGLSAASAKGSPWNPPVHPEDRAAFEEHWKHCLASGEALDLQCRLRGRDESFRWFALRAAPVPGANGGPIGWYGVCTDIEEQKRAERVLRETARIVELSQDAVILAGPDGTVTHWSAGAEQVYGIPRDRAVGQPLHTLLRTGSAVQWAMEEALARTGRWDGEVAWQRPDGSTIRIERHQVLARGPGGEPLGLLTISRDVTQSRQSEAAPRESDAPLHLALEAAGLGTFSVDLDSGAVSVSKAAAALFPREAAPATVEEWIEAVVPEDRDRVRECFAAAAAGSGSFEVECRILSGDDVRWLLIKGMPFDNPRRLAGVTQDITARRLTEESLRAGAAELEATLDAVPAAIFIARDPEARNILGNRMAYDFLGVPQGGNLSKTAPEGEPPGDWRPMRDGVPLAPQDLPVQTAARTGQALRDYRFDAVFPDGSIRRLFGNAVPLLDAEGRPRGSVAAFVDVTEQGRTEERLREAHKSESIGLLAGGIAHEFNNLLTTIMGNAAMVLEHGVYTEQLQGILSSAERAAELTRHLLAYAGKGRFVLGHVNVPATVTAMEDLLRVSVSSHIDVRVSALPDEHSVVCDPDQIRQIVLNLTTNAAEAIGETRSGWIGITAGFRRLEAAVETAVGTLEAGDYQFIQVSDDGCGMDERTMTRIFDPFFSTKFTGRGLGLAAVAGIVRVVRGGILVKSEPGAGTTFTVLLPAMAVAAAPEKESPGHILLMQSDPDLRAFLEATLRSAGYRLTTVSGGLDALAAVRDRRVDVVIADASGHASPAVIAEMQRLEPQLHFVFTGGFPEVPPSHSTFLEEPHTAGRVLNSVQAVIASRRTPLRPITASGRGI